MENHQLVEQVVRDCGVVRFDVLVNVKQIEVGFVPVFGVHFLARNRQSHFHCVAVSPFYKFKKENPGCGRFWRRNGGLLFVRLPLPWWRTANCWSTYHSWPEMIFEPEQRAQLPCPDIRRRPFCRDSMLSSNIELFSSNWLPPRICFCLRNTDLFLKILRW